jgi:DNA-binding GntR family transcriptional regulator
VSEPEARAPASATAGPPKLNSDQSLTITRPASLREIVFDTLVERIISRELAPGHHLGEGELAAQLGVSRQPVREALQQLRAGGWVDLRPNQGAFVHAPTQEQADDLLIVRSMLETESVRLATIKRSSADIAKLWSIWHRGLEALGADDVDGMVAANAKFHATIMKAAGNSVLEELGQLVDRRVRWYFTPIAQARGRDSWDEHAAIIHALEDKDSTNAARIMREHTERTRLVRHHPGD